MGEPKIKALNHTIFATTSFISSLLPIVVFLVLRKRNNTKPLWVIFFYIVFAFIFDIVRSLNESQVFDFYLYRIFTTLEFFAFAYYLRSILTSPFARWGIPIATIVIVGLTVKNIITADINEEFDALTTSLEALFIILLSINYFYEVIQKNSVSLIYASKSFWMVVAMLVYLSANLFLFITSKYLTPEERHFYWFINDTANTLKNILMMIAFLLPRNDLSSKADQPRPYDELFEKPPFIN